MRKKTKRRDRVKENQKFSVNYESIKSIEVKKDLIYYLKLILNKAYFISSIVATLVGFTAFSFFSPKIEVSASQTLNDLNPFATLVEIHNAGGFDMSDIQLSLTAEKVDTWDIMTKEPYLEFDSIGIEGKFFRKSLIRKDEYWTVRLPFEPIIVIKNPNLRLRYANVKLEIKYKYLWQNKEKVFRLVGGSDFNGKVIWTRQPE